MRRIVLIFLSLLLASVQLHSLEIKVNGRIWKTFSHAFLAELEYSVDPADPGLKGITLDEILPPMIDAYRLVAESGSDNTVWEADDLTGSFPAGYITVQDNDCSVFLEGRKADHVSRIEISGEIIEDRRLEIWVSWEGVPQLKEEIERYASMHDTEIKVIEVPKTASKLISVLRGGGTPPDILLVQSDYIPILTGARALQNLDYMDLDRFDPRGVKAFTLENRLWGIPFYCDPQVVFINRALIPNPPGFDWTLSDFEALSEGLKEKGIIPASWNAYSASWLIPFQMAFGKPKLLEDDGSIIINDSASIEALEYILYLRDKGYLEVLERDAMVSLFIAGKVAMILSGSYSIPGFEAIDLDFSVLPYPENDTTGDYAAPLLDYKALSITRRTRHPILSRRLIEFLTGPGVQQRFPPSLSKLAINREAVVLGKNLTPHFACLVESSERGTPIPPNKAYGIYKNTMWSLLRFAFTGQMSPEEVLDKGQELIDAQLKP